MKRIIFLFLIFGLVFTHPIKDIGPSPEAPDITVDLMVDGNPYSGYFELNYFCTTPTSGEGGDSTMDERSIGFACTEGTCMNVYWFYKLNPCFSGASGYFTYEFQGEEMNSDPINFESEETYKLYLDLPTGELSEQSSEDEDQEDEAKLCPFLIFLSLPLLAIIKYK